MAGITRSLELIEKGFNIGNVLDVDRCVNNRGYVETRMSVKFDKGGLDSFIDYGSDNKISHYIRSGDRVGLFRVDDYGAYWGSLSSVDRDFDYDDLKPC